MILPKSARVISDFVHCTNPAPTPISALCRTQSPKSSWFAQRFSAVIERVKSMSNIFSFSALLALPLAMAAFALPAHAASAEYCTFTSPASMTCPAEAQAAARATPPQPAILAAAGDHCVATSPASSACPVAPQTSAVATAGTPLRISRN
jgi:hypothetical protein